MEGGRGVRGEGERAADRGQRGKREVKTGLTLIRNHIVPDRHTPSPVDYLLVIFLQQRLRVLFSNGMKIEKAFTCPLVFPIFIQSKGSFFFSLTP